MSCKDRRRSPGHRRSHLEALEPRQVLSGSSFVPALFEPSASNPVQEVRVVVLNFEPTVPTQDNRTLWDVFGWNDPRELAEGYISDVETASGGAIDYQVVEWRDLNEFPIFTDGSRYTADQYVANRITNTGWSEATADFYAIAEQQGLADLVNSNQIDEIWMFGDHFFSLLGEAWMAGPQSFFVNGPSFPDFAVDHAVAGFGFNYERGVAEMVHNLGHRTENHLSRAYGGWDIQNPSTPWDFFTANVAQSNATAYGVGSIHYPFNGASDYDYANTRTFATYADDFVENFPDHTFEAVVDGRDAWGDFGVGDWQRGYLGWFFGHVPRGDGEASDGRENNWYKYIFDFNSYRPGTGVARDNEAILGAAPLVEGGDAGYEFTLRYYDTTGIDETTLDGADVLVTGPGGFSELASLVQVGNASPTTAGSAQSVRYRVAAPGGVWDSADSGTYSVTLRTGQVRDATGSFLSGALLGQFRVDISDSGRLDVSALLTTGQASVNATVWDIGGPAAVFDNNAASLYRTPNIDPAVITLSFSEPQLLTGFRTLFSHAGGNPAYRWKVEAADTIGDLDTQAGTYTLLVLPTETPSDSYSTQLLASPTEARYVRLTAERLTGDDYVHINAWDLLTEAVADVESPTATLLAPATTPSDAASQSFVVRFADDRAIDIASVNYGDVVVTGPNGTAQIAALYGLDANVNGGSRDVTYFIAAPGGAWDYTDNGEYIVSVAAGQVRDTSGKPVAAGVIGSFDIDLATPELRPFADMTELNAASWQASADAATATTYDDTGRKVLGESSVRFETNGGFDTYLRYAPASGAQWDLSDASEFHFSLFAENPSQFDFQQEPIVRFTDADGAIRELRYYRAGAPHILWNDAVGRWIDVSIPMKSLTLPATGWRAINPSEFDWTRVRSVEIHADTWDAGFTLWVDRAGFNLPLKVVSASHQLTGAGDRIRLDLDAPELQISPTTPFQLQTLSGGTPGNEAQAVIATADSPGEGTRLEVTFPGQPGGTLAPGVYRLTVPVGSVADVAGNSLGQDFVYDFSTLPGDYDANGAVERADGDLWRSSYGSTTDLAADGNGDGVVDAADYTVWRDHLGAGTSYATTPVAVSLAIGTALPLAHEPVVEEDIIAAAEAESITASAIVPWTGGAIPTNRFRLGQTYQHRPDESSRVRLIARDHGLLSAARSSSRAATPIDFPIDHPATPDSELTLDDAFESFQHVYESQGVRNA